MKRILIRVKWRRLGNAGSMLSSALASWFTLSGQAYQMPYTMISLIAGILLTTYLQRLKGEIRIVLTLNFDQFRFGMRGTKVAAFIAGRRRNMESAWLADLHGDPEGDDTPTPRQKVRKVLGFLLASIRFRLHDWFWWAWVPVDRVLADKKWREGFVSAVVGAHAIYITASDGLHTLLTFGWAWLSGSGVAAWGLLQWLERLRGVELANTDSSPDE